MLCKTSRVKRWQQQQSTKLPPIALTQLGNSY
jgi:hypothetical protein